MADTLGYRCPNCGGDIVFDSEKQKMVCPFCDAEYEVSYFDKQKEELDKAEEGVRDTWQDDEIRGMFVYKCSYCNGEIIGDETTSATTCPYCDMPVVLKERFAGGLKPDHIIPFKIKKNEAVKKLEEFCKDKKLLPDEFTRNNRIETLKGMYVPFWLYDCNAKADMHIEGSKNGKSWSDSSYRYTESEVFDVHRNGSVEFKNVPVDGSKKMDNSYMESLEPYDYKDLVEFNSAYLAGYLADKYDENAEECEQRATDRIEKTVKEMFLNDLSGYSNKNITDCKIVPNYTKKSYTLLPVWMLSTNYNGQIYTYAMNGQTGKFIGKLPIDEKKAKRNTLMGFLKVVGIGTAIIVAVALIL